MPNMLTDWLGDSNDLTKPKVLETAKALRQRKSAVDRAQASRGIPQVGTGNLFQRRRAGMEQVLNDAGK